MSSQDIHLDVWSIDPPCEDWTRDEPIECAWCGERSDIDAYDCLGAWEEQGLFCPECGRMIVPGDGVREWKIPDEHQPEYCL